MASFYSVFLLIALSLWGAAIGGAAGIWGPFLLGNILAWATKDKSDSGLGFFIILTVPVFAVYGGIQGYTFALKVIASVEKLSYLSHGTGLWQAVSFFVFGTAGLIFVLYAFMK